MNVIKTDIEGVLILEPKICRDERGYFSVCFSEADFPFDTRFVQDNESRSLYGVVRGLHYQLPPHAQAKLVRVVMGEVLDVAVDLRHGSPTFGRHAAVRLSGENHRQLFIPQGFAHGFSVLTPEAVVLYKCDNHYAPQSEGGIAFDDPALGIDWLIPRERMIVSEKDRRHPRMADARLFDHDENLYPR